MSISEAPSTKPQTAREWHDFCAPWSKHDLWRSVRQLVGTFTLFILFWTLAYQALSISYLLAFVLCIPAGSFVVRLFMIQHDCGHGSFFKSKRTAEIVGFIIGVITLTPYHYWRRAHAYHHQHSGDLDFRGIGDISMLTVQEYEKRSKWGKLGYRLYRNPFVLFLLGPAYQFVFRHRFPGGVPKTWKIELRSVWLTNAAIVTAILAFGTLLGFKEFLLIQIPVTLVASSLGVWLFYVQHQFEETYYYWHKDWDYVDAALKGSTHLVLPKPFAWLTANIGIHHVHHLNSHIPNYKLEECMKASPDLQKATQVTMHDTWKLIYMTLWDEANEKMVSFREYHNSIKKSSEGSTTTS